jgi:small subunit ribosomal protein S1
VEIPEQVVQVGEEIFVKIIDIDLDRRRISLSLKQANEGAAGEAAGEEFDPTLYGMPATYDEAGNYQYPDGFDSESGDWLPGFEAQREEWERQYAEARSRFEAHRRQIEESRAKAEEEGEEDGEATAAASSTTTTTTSSGSRPRGAARPGAPQDSNAPSGTLASDEALAALRDKLSGQS